MTKPPDTGRDIHPFQAEVTCGQRNQLNRHGSGLLWFYGLSGSGKSTLAHGVESHLYKRGVRTYVLDGDNVRTGLNSDLGLSPQDRRENIRRIAEVARLMVDAGILVMAAFITPYQESRDFVRQILTGQPYYECFVRCPVEVCAQRDPKGLYAKASAGQISNLTGVSAPFEEPVTPDLTVDTSQVNLEQAVQEVVGFLTSKGLISLQG